MKAINHFTNLEIILNYLNKNPVYISGFANGEGSFTASSILDLRAKWCLYLQCEFNITQLMDDELLLKAINLYFKNAGDVYPKRKIILVQFHLEKYLY